MKDTNINAEALKKSRNIRTEFLSKYGIDGIMPDSILKYENAIRVIIDLYCHENGTIFDPFMGSSDRMQMAFKLGRNYIGYDICHETIVKNEKIKETLYKYQEESLKIIDHKNWIKLFECSSDQVSLDDNSMDFTITSPPYWNFKKYKPEKKELSNAKTYESFLESLGNHIRENYRVLKPGAFAAWCVNDLRRDGKFYPNHIRIYQKMIDAGFMPFQIYTTDLGRTINHLFVQDIINYRVLSKRHEYILLMRKEGPNWWEKTK